jgi:hypothetical protein
VSAAVGVAVGVGVGVGAAVGATSDGAAIAADGEADCVVLAHPAISTAETRKIGRRIPATTRPIDASRDVTGFSHGLNSRPSM